MIHEQLCLFDPAPTVDDGDELDPRRLAALGVGEVAVLALRDGGGPRSVAQTAVALGWTRDIVRRVEGSARLHYNAELLPDAA